MLLKDKKVILASGSPRRIAMLKEDGAEPVIIRPGCSEELHTELTPRQAVMSLALRKALTAAETLKDSTEPYLLIAADTVVDFEGQIIGKPKDEADAFRILSLLNGKMNQVHTGVCILQNIPKFTIVFSDTSDVYFKRYTEQNIRDYIATGEPMDKAGAYAIQGGFACYVDHFDGAYDNIVGLPYQRIKDLLSGM